MVAVTQPAVADTSGPGYDLHGVEDGGYTMWLGGLENPNDPNWLMWCIEAGKPIPEAAATSMNTINQTAVKNQGQGEFLLTTAEMAWILKNKEPIATADSRACPHELRANRPAYHRTYAPRRPQPSSTSS